MRRKKPILSIVMPVYNSEKTLEKAIESVMSQSASVELIIIDDGSTDQTLKIAKSFSKKSTVIKIVTQQNSGPAQARNTGISRAQGEYILFLDADDEFLPESLVELSSYLIDKNVDMICFGYMLADTHNHEWYYSPGGTKLITSGHMGEHLRELYQANMLNQVWNKAYKRSILNKKKLRFPDYKYGEDRLFVFKSLQMVQSLFVLDRPCYKYNNSPSGTLVTRYYDKKFDVAKLIDDQARKTFDFFKATTKKDQKVLDEMFIKMLTACLVNENTQPDSKRITPAIRKIMADTSITPILKRSMIRSDVYGLVAAWLLMLRTSGGVSLAKLVSLLTTTSPQLLRKMKHTEKKCDA